MLNVTYFLYFLIIILLIMAFKILLSIINSSNESRKQKTRNQQLEMQSKKKVKEDDNDEQIRQVLHKVTEPIIDNVIGGRKIKNPKLLERKLHIAGWDKYFTPIQWKAFELLLRVLAVVMFALFFKASWIFALVWLVVFGIGPGFLLNNSYNNITDKLLLSFPETINIIYGYLSAGMTMQKAFEETARNASPEWKTLLEQFVAKCNTTDMFEALDWLKEEVGISEGREFFATVRLSLELGSSAKNGFAEQADRINKLLRDAMQKKIEARKVWATVVQGPVLLLVMGSFALPLMGTMLDIF